MENLDELLEKKERINNLYDTYKELFTTKQKEYFESYYFDDLSLSEIATNFNVSRNAVFTSLKAIVSSLEEYEEKLKINYKKEEINKILDSNSKLEIIKEEIKNIL